ncbi:MAG: PRC-barrel domain-containing protein [Pseudohongiella sp.]|nr:PRC-barrel domain-containing protein [Pseudohongiella sp.]
MKKLHAFALSMFLTPVVALGSAAVLAQQSSAQPNPNQQQTTQQQQNPNQQQTTQQQQNQQLQGNRQPGSAQGNAGQSRMERRGFVDSTPMNGMRISDLMDADVRTTGNDNIGSVTDVIVDESGSIVALVVGVGGFLGIGQRDVAIGWDDVTKTRSGDDYELRVSLTRDSLTSAPEFRRVSN